MVASVACNNPLTNHSSRRLRDGVKRRIAREETTSEILFSKGRFRCIIISPSVLSSLLSSTLIHARYSWFASLDAPPGPITAQLVAGTEQRFGKRARGNRVEFQGLLIVATCDGTDRVFSRIIFISFLTINCPIISRFHLLFSFLSFFFSRKLLSFSSSHCFAH